MATLTTSNSFEPEDPRADTDGYPTPAGYRILVRLPAQSDQITMASGVKIYKPQTALDPERHLAQTAQVVAIGRDAYHGRVTGNGVNVDFPNGPWVRVGDYVSFSKYAGTRYLIRDREVRLINDDEVQAVVPNPEILKSAS